MDHFYSPQPVETISLNVESSPVWEVILGISGFTHSKLRHTFEFDETWTNQVPRMPLSLQKNLKMIEETNSWYGMIMLQNEFSAQTIQEFSNGLREISRVTFYETLLPYLNRETEQIRKKTALNYAKDGIIAAYATYFEDHEFLAGYIRSLEEYGYENLCDLIRDTVQEWYEFVSKQQDWEKWCAALTYEQKQHQSLDITAPTHEIERLTGGVLYYPEPSVWHVKLIPHVAYRPWVLEKRTHDTKLFFYPLNESYLLEPGVPSKELVRGHKALGEELRLKLLYKILQGEVSLQEMSAYFNTSKTTLHHHLSLLKAAKFIRVEKGVYSVNLSQIHRFSDQLTQYLGTNE
ncbi:MAG: winged helix-turn-helix domain-containing protein [Anaerobacillus sp.]